MRIKTEIKRLMKERDSIQKRLNYLQKQCKHKGATFEYKSNVGNYDPSADSYWKHWSCPTCLSSWIEEY